MLLHNQDLLLQFFYRIQQLYHSPSFCDKGSLLQAQDFSEKATTDINDPKYKEDQATLKTFYEKAKPYYEKARELKPDQKDLWLNGLYRVYYNLQMGPEFEEIEKLM